MFKRHFIDLFLPAVSSLGTALRLLLARPFLITSDDCAALLILLIVVLLARIFYPLLFQSPSIMTSEKRHTQGLLFFPRARL